MFKVLIALTFSALAFASCSYFSKKSQSEFYGNTFDTTKALTVSQMLTQVSTQPNADAVVRGTITSSCKSEGCWLKLDAGNGSDVFVSTEEKFFIPKDGMAGKTVYVHGVTSLDTTSVVELRHYAKDEGKSDEDIERITEPKVEVSMIATGVRVL